MLFFNSSKYKKQQNHFTIIIDCCNQESWIRKCLESCLNQQFINFDVILMDALSNDKTFEIAKEYENVYSNLKIFQNKVRQPQIANILELTKLAKPETILVSVDGDDWLPNNYILKKLDKVYSSNNIWMTYGTYYEFPDRSVSNIYQAYPNSIIDSNSFREYRWLASHLRTYRRELFLKINENDFLRDDGKWLDTAGDLAFMIPMLEMSGRKSRYIKEIMYIYNVADLNRDGNINEKRQIELANYIRNKPKYKILDTL
jgi:glycosyltransferase involved in cell wall biosynthesis